MYSVNYDAYLKVLYLITKFYPYICFDLLARLFIIQGLNGHSLDCYIYKTTVKHLMEYRYKTLN